MIQLIKDCWRMLFGPECPEREHEWDYHLGNGYIIHKCKKCPASYTSGP